MTFLALIKIGYLGEQMSFVVGALKMFAVDCTVSRKQSPGVTRAHFLGPVWPTWTDLPSGPLGPVWPARGGTGFPFTSTGRDHKS